MRQLIRQLEIVSDDWRHAEQDPLGESASLIIPFAQWQQEREQWLARKIRLGVRLGPAHPVESLAPDLNSLSLVAIEFGGISEGRGYTQAQMLRQRYKFTGEVRAVGKVQRDQFFYMARCGFDAFELPEGADLEGALASFKDFTVAYQPAADVAVTLRRRVS
jgi:uncharacterized protein (DUF934 family)